MGFIEKISVNFATIKIENTAGYKKICHSENNAMIVQSKQIY